MYVLASFWPGSFALFVSSSIAVGGTSTVFYMMAQLTLFNEAPKHKSVAPQALKNAFLWLSWPSLMRGYEHTFLYDGPIDPL